MKTTIKFLRHVPTLVTPKFALNKLKLSSMIFDETPLGTKRVSSRMVSYHVLKMDKAKDS